MVRTLNHQKPLCRYFFIFKFLHLPLTVCACIRPISLLSLLPPCHCLHSERCDVIGRSESNCDVAPMTSSTENPCVGHVTSERVVTSGVDVGDETLSLLLGRIDDVTSVREPVSKNVKVFVCSTGTGC